MTDNTISTPQRAAVPSVQIQWPCWSTLIWQGSGLSRYVLQLRELNSERREHMDSYLQVHLSLEGTHTRLVLPVAVYGSIPTARPNSPGHGKDEGWFPLCPQYDETALTPSQIATMGREFEQQLRQLVEFLNGQLLGTNWRCHWIDVMTRETREDDGRGVYEQVDRRRGYTFPSPSAAEAGFAKDVDFVIG